LAFTITLKHKQMRKCGIPADEIHDVQEGHLIPLELGDAPDGPANPWPEPFKARWDATLKDDLERALNRKVCLGRLPLVEAQRAIRTNWIAAYRKYMTSRARGNR
jgi:hypothetical protein